MTRLFVYLVLVLALGFGFSWIADHPGVVTLNWQGKDIRTSLMVVVVALVVIIAIILLVWSILRGVIGFPTFMSRFFSNRRRDRGYQALSRGLIAAGTGDKVAARRLTKESGKLLTNEPLVELLDAQTALLEGNRKDARSRFQAMLDNDETKLLGLRGLYLEAEREGAREASRQYAQEASEIAPSLAWAGNAKMRNLTLEGNWTEALSTLESHRAAGLLDKETAKRQRAVLLTARAISEEPAHPEIAVKLAKEAHRLVPDLVPAATIGAKALVRANKLRNAAKMIESTWKKFPHPDLAEAYVHMRLGDSATDRLKRAQSLAKFRANHPEGSITVGEAAIEAKDWKTAREAMKPVITNHLTERACLIMADIEEGEHGDAGRMRDWLSKAVRAPRDAKWTAGGFTSEFWLPVSPQTGEIDVFEWKVPVEALQSTNDALDIGDLAEPLKPIADSSKSAEPAIAASAALGASTIVDDNDTEVADEKAGEVINESETKTAEILELVPASASVEKPSGDKNAKADDDKPSKPSEGNTKNKQIKTVFPLKHRPDDPGVSDPVEDEEKGFKIF